MPMFRRAFALLVILLTGCSRFPLSDSITTIGKHDDPINTTVPHQWRDDPVDFPKWQELILSEQLEQLIHQAIDHNQNLLSQKALWRAAVERIQVANADLWPSVDGSLRTNRYEEKFRNNYSGEVSVKWELDTWGRLDANRKASFYNEQQKAYSLQWITYSLAADVSRIYINLISLKRQWLLAQQREKSLQQSLEVIEDGYHVGIRDALDVYSARAEFIGGQVDSVAREREYTANLKDLCLLLGQMPDYPLIIPDTLPSSSAMESKNITSNLLARRPDVKEALFRIYEQQAQLHIAKVNRFPQFTISGSYNNRNESFSDIFSVDSAAWNLVGGITAPLFNAGKLSHQQQVQQELLTAQVANFRQVLLTAVKEAQQRLDDQLLIQQQLTLSEQSAAISDQAERQAFERYIAGIQNLNTWLQAQRTAFQRRTQLVNLQSELIKRRIDLHLAVGGDFSSSIPPALQSNL